MSDAELRDLVVEILGDIAPEADTDGLDPTADLVDELDLDSMDLLNLVSGLEERLGVTVPERDYPEVRTLDGAVAYLRRRQPAPS
jgi:acyl carrier protein